MICTRRLPEAYNYPLKFLNFDFTMFFSSLIQLPEFSLLMLFQKSIFGEFRWVIFIAIVLVLFFFFMKSCCLDSYGVLVVFFFPDVIFIYVGVEPVRRSFTHYHAFMLSPSPLGKVNLAWLYHAFMLSNLQRIGPCSVFSFQKHQCLGFFLFRKVEKIALTHLYCGTIQGSYKVAMNYASDFILIV